MLLKKYPLFYLATATSMVSSTLGSRAELMHSIPLHDIIPLLSPQEAAFFTILDQQLDKVESFYCAREEEMLQRGHILRSQLNDLEGHRNLLQVSNVFTFFMNMAHPLFRRCPCTGHQISSLHSFPVCPTPTGALYHRRPS